MKILITGSAGFIGFHTAMALLSEGHEVVGVDNINNYYDVSLKIGRLEASGINRRKVAYNEVAQSEVYPNYSFVQLNLEDGLGLTRLFAQCQFDAVIHLAAQAGVRYSIKNPRAYLDSNITGFLNILESCRHFPVKHLVYASSSSVYGLNTKVPFAVSDPVNHPVSLYAASKKTNELMAHTYSHLYQIPSTGLRFFTVYGPWGRPDMAYFLFTESILKGRPIQVFNNGLMKRDFTYVDDIVQGVVKVLQSPPLPDSSWDRMKMDSATSSAPYRIYNIGNNHPVSLTDFIEALELAIGKKANKEYLPMQAGDVEETFADVDGLEKDFGYKPTTSIQHGLQAFVDWYRGYYKL